MQLSRRQLLAASAATGLTSLLKPADAIISPFKKRFRFVHLTDLHIQPELGAADGVSAAIKKILSLKQRPDFILTGGDHYMDLLNVNRGRADLQTSLLTERFKQLEMPVRCAIGNHDVFGWGKRDADQKDALYGKGMIEERLIKDKSYRSFDFLGWHFITLDSIQPKEGGWHGRIDDDQMNWLSSDLEKVGKSPTVIVTHMPIVTAFNQYNESSTSAASDTLILGNGKEVVDLIAKHNVKAVLQGHTHVIENCIYNGTEYMTCGAICGDWWKGPRLGIHPEGFTVFDIDGDKISHQYVTYGWTARK